MTSISSSFAQVPRRQYVASGVFNTNFFSYTTTVDRSLQTRGSLTIVSGANQTSCRAGRILRENGKKLFKGTHPDLKDPTTQFEYNLLIGVYDIISGLNGFIDPNSPLFAPFNTDKSYQQDLVVEAVDSTGLKEEGPPVFTTGTITTTTGNILATTGTVTSTKINISPVTAGPPGTATTGTLAAPLTTSAGRAFLVNGVQTIYTTACTANSMVLVSVNNGVGLGVPVSVLPSAGSFQVVVDRATGNAAGFNWMVIN
jgi:hypothetical protein